MAADRTTGGPLTGLVKATEVRAALKQCVDDGPIGRRKAPLLRQFTYLAVATHKLLPGEVRDVRPTTYAKLTGRPQRVPPLARSAAKPLRFVRRTALGRRVWSSVRNRLLH